MYAGSEERNGEGNQRAEEGQTSVSEQAAGPPRKRQELEASAIVKVG